MKLSKRTIDVLRNFATVNMSIVVNPGNKLSTMAVARNILAEADVAETFEKEFSIYNLNEFLAAVSLFSDPELIFDEKWVLIQESGAKRGGVKYWYSSKALIVHPTKSIQMPPDITVEFTLQEAAFIKLQKASNVLGVSDVVIAGDSEGISMIVRDKKNESSNDYEIRVSEEPQSQEFKHYFRQENLKFLPGDYQVQISPKGISSFKSVDGTIRYAVALEQQ